MSVLSSVTRAEMFESRVELRHGYTSVLGHHYQLARLLQTTGLVKHILIINHRVFRDIILYFEIKQNAAYKSRLLIILG